jgi:hypothetical protein
MKDNWKEEVLKRLEFDNNEMVRYGDIKKFFNDEIQYLLTQLESEVGETLDDLLEATQAKINERGGTDWRRGKLAGLKRAKRCITDLIKKYRK